MRQQADRLYRLADHELRESSFRQCLVHHDSSKFAVLPTINEKEVYATFLSTRVGKNAPEGEFEHDWYYKSTRVLIHRLLRNPSTRGRRRVVVLVTENVAQWKRERLAADGAVIILVPIIQIPNIPSREATWVDQFTKLQLWKLTEYERIVYMDSDLFPLINTEELFHLDLDQHSSQDPPFNYSFAATPNLVGKNDKGQLIIGPGFNAGFFVLKPDQAMFDRIWARAMDPEQPWNMNKDMEQGLLNDIFVTSGHSPMYRLEWTWNVKDMPDEFLERSKIVHSRWWLTDQNLVGPKQMAEWWKTLGQVEGFWEAAP